MSGTEIPADEEPSISSTPPWVAEVEVDQARARTILRRQFPELSVGTVETFGTGWDNTAFLVNGKWVFRFPRKQMSVALLKQEIAFLPALQQRFPRLSISSPSFVGEPSSLFPWPFAGYRVVKGRTLETCALSSAQRSKLGVCLAFFLKTLHESPVPEGLGPDPVGRFKREERQRQVSRRIQELRTASVPWLTSRLESFWEQILGVEFCTKAHKVFLHGDLYCRHLVLNNRHELAGVIDWGDIHEGPAAVDLGTVLPILDREGLSRFRDHYEATEGCWRMAFFRGLTHSLAVITFALQTGQSDLYREGERGLLSLGEKWNELGV